MKKFGWFFIIAALLVGCANSAPVSTPTILPSPTFTRTPAPTATARITPGISSTKIPTLTPEPTPVPTATPTPAPTLQPEEAKEVFGQWMLGEPDCLLPCWAGIVPGETTWDEAIRLVSPVTEIAKIFVEYNCLGGLCNGFDWELTQLQAGQGVFIPVSGSVDTGGGEEVAKISVNTRTPEVSVGLGMILETYGFPEKILVKVTDSSTEEVYNLDMILSFPAHSFALRYIRDAQIQENNIVACGEPTLTSLHIVDDEENSWSFEKILGIVFGAGENETGYQDLEVVSNLSVESFYYYFIKYPTACFSTPLSNWQ